MHVDKVIFPLIFFFTHVHFRPGHVETVPPDFETQTFTTERASFSVPSTRANDETGPPKPADHVDRQVKGAVARPVSTGCPTVEPELN